MGDEEFRKHRIGTGPFRFAVHQPKQGVQLSANQSYFRGSPQLESVSRSFYPDAQERYHAFKLGQLDLIRAGYEITAENLLPKETIVDAFGVPEVAIRNFNTAVKPLNDIRVRKAIAYALDRNLFLASFDGLTTTNVFSPIPHEHLPGGLSEEQVKTLDLDYAYNPEKAKTLLKEAGYQTGSS